MNLTDLIDRIAEYTAHLIPSLENLQEPYRLGLRRSARLPVLAALLSRAQRPALLITDRSDHALALFDELGLWLPQARRLFFPEPNPLFYERQPWGENTRRDRLLALSSLAAYHIPGSPAHQRQTSPEIIVAPARAIMARTIPRRDFLKAARRIRQGELAPPDELARTWVALGYEPVNTVIRPGQFARRGGILDIWPPAEQHPTRLEFFGDEVDTLRHFDPASQRTTQTQGDVMVTPAREFIAHPLPDNQDETELSEFHIPYFHPSPASLLDYLPRHALVLYDNLQAVHDMVQEVEEQAVRASRELVAEGALAANAPLPYLTWVEITDSLPRNRQIELGPSSSETPDPVAGRFGAGPRFGGRLKPFLEHIADQGRRREPVVIVSRQAARIQELWQEQAYALKDQEFLPPDILSGSLAEGWSFITGAGQETGPSLHLYTDGEIFGWRRPEPRHRPRPVAEAPEAAYADLQAGDFVVHVDHGIGCFIGLVNRTIEGIEREYLCVEYANEAQLYVPVHQADRITRYIGPDSRTPSLSRLGGAEWRNVKNYVKEAVQEVAEELLELYARRSVVTGYAFSLDTPWQQELEASFPYIETDDQLRVLREVKMDMQATRPMDRLVCGDVGYGKTEVALRAAFKAVMEGRQVAVLVPTTVLAQQHYQTFRQRLAAFPAEVEMLSRFRNAQEQRQIIRRLAAGGIDIVIGTHRLLSADVTFKDLGLLVIDEEQRFGVSHKETLKKMRTEVDVLTMTATPIPRTLYMTLTGVRDISMISTPPEERLPIITHVGPYSPRLVRQAVLRELERGGQIFFVHNRVQTIEAMHSHLAQLIPEARLTVAHGQMPENELSERMQRFAAGEVDILLCTSIIESGLDIPNANTLIVDRADTFGLAQLYQLRGRVGRGAQRAYAYFFRHRRRPPSAEGRQRLDTIAENTQLGAGLSIAMRDLEIRGAGDLLGTRQHGHIAAVGFHLYTRLLADAVQRLRRKGDIPRTALPGSLPGTLDQQLSLPVNVDLPLAASIPASYVPDKGMRLHLYRRLADIRTLDEIDALREEFNDRFGPLPELVENLLYQLKVKLLAEKAGLASISGDNGQIVFRYPEGTTPPSVPSLGPTVRAGKTALWMPYRALPDWPDRLLEVLQELQAYQPHLAMV